MQRFESKARLWLACCMLMLPYAGRSQEFKPMVTHHFLITNARVVSAPGQSPVLTNIRIRDGVIDELGAQLTARFDEKEIKADSQFVYAGFIDAMSYAGIKKEEEKKEERKDNARSGSRGAVNFEQAGITPQINALSRINAREASISDLRKSGFVLAQVFPRGRMLAGSSTVISLGEADHEDKLVAKAPASMLASFTTANGVAPATVIGVIAKFKELFKNTGIYYDNEIAYSKLSSGVKKPVYAEELAAMVPLHNKQMWMYFVTPKSKDIYRAIELQKHSNYNTVLADIQHLGPALPAVKNGGFSVVLSTILPEEVKEEKKEKEGQEKGKEEKKQTTTPKTDEELALEKRKQESYKDYMEQAALCEKNNISFAFGTGNAKIGDILKNIRRMVKAGLSEKTALSALTTVPASMLKLSSLYGTIEKGKVASLVFFDKPLFDEKANVKQVWVEGLPFINDEKPKPESKGSETGVKPEGSWSYTVDMGGQTQTGKFTFKKEGKTYSGTSIDDFNPSEEGIMEDLVIDGNTVKFKINVDPVQPINAYLELTFTSDNYTGTVNIDGMGSFTIKGNKISGPNH